MKTRNTNYCIYIWNRAFHFQGSTPFELYLIHLRRVFDEKFIQVGSKFIGLVLEVWRILFLRNETHLNPSWHPDISWYILIYQLIYPDISYPDISRYIRYILTVIKHGWQITEHAVSEHLFMGTSSNWEDFAGAHPLGIDGPLLHHGRQWSISSRCTDSTCKPNDVKAIFNT